MIYNLIRQPPLGHPGRRALRMALTTTMRRRRRKREREKTRRKMMTLQLREVLTNLSSPVRNAAS